ncbi:MAG: tRNA ((37)-N6)-threonylcarbamoyltransferase complex dimerization subunit type 1 TsaB [Massilia sp.]|jgi:tRNA threonylcarbamoyladenosine biosynthesis protein TsaB|nr:tRNA ((37)-N6)-threonylcarbamoyltransferase complex dimerization subunit type 1 TsaB [Massilia sp.]MDB5952990.1 tRNA ((37)-N6)-threonylcarbamoyltransferase complex dimerization subunit type 1 TsaB [Massilia sp.]
MPIILAIETSSELASCALLNGDTLLARSSSGVRTHSQSILPMVQELLAEAGVALADCDAIAFGSGPGSFTGVRTACGIAQGLAFGAGLPAVPVVTLAAMALACRQQSGAADVLAVLDARMGEVYWAQYRYDDSDHSGACHEVVAPTLCAPGDVAPLPTETPLAACGNGLSAYAEAFAGRDFAGAALAAIMPHASCVAQLARIELAAGRSVKAAEAQPLYLRNKIAFTSAERQVINAAKAAA